MYYYPLPLSVRGDGIQDSLHLDQYHPDPYYHHNDEIPRSNPSYTQHSPLESKRRKLVSRSSAQRDCRDEAAYDSPVRRDAHYQLAPPQPTSSPYYDMEIETHHRNSPSEYSWGSPGRAEKSKHSRAPSVVSSKSSHSSSGAKLHGRATSRRSDANSRYSTHDYPSTREKDSRHHDSRTELPQAPYAPDLGRLSTPDLQPVSSHHSFCSCCDVARCCCFQLRDGSSLSTKHSRSRSKADAQCKSASAGKGRRQTYIR
jgi:hypothetical protein